MESLRKMMREEKEITGIGSLFLLIGPMIHPIEIPPFARMALVSAIQPQLIPRGLVK